MFVRRIVAFVFVPVGVIALATGMPAGCAREPSLPPPVDVRGGDREVTFEFDTDGDKRADFWQYQAVGGRKRAIAFVDEQGGVPGRRVELDGIAADDVPHFVIILDGVPFEVVDEMYRAGHFRMFHPPSRVICCFPSMTDLALADLLHAGKCRAFQADYYDRDAGRMSSGNDAYLSALNSPWVAKIDYRCSFLWDILVYLDPQTVFNHEMGDMLDAFRAIDTGTGIGYTVGSAGLGTRGSRAAIEKYLQTIDRLCEQIVYERRGRVKLTLTADHGHNLVENRRITLDKTLKTGGYRLRERLDDERDVIAIGYGLVTFVELYTRDPSGVADCLLGRINRDSARKSPVLQPGRSDDSVQGPERATSHAGHEDVEFACFPDDDRIVVRDRQGEAYVTRAADGFTYDARGGDPLRLLPIIDKLRAAGCVSRDGVIDDDALFEATLDHYYPDPLRRVWRAFHELVENPPDLIVNLRDGACYGSAFFHFMIKKMSSTHGSLNRLNSTTFAMTMLGELPAALRGEEVLPTLEKLRGVGDAVSAEDASETP